MLVDLLDEAGGAPESVALASDERRWTYAELDRAVSDRADALQADGAARGRVVPVTADATPETVIELLALWRAGMTPAPLNSRLTPSERHAAVQALADVRSEAQAVLWTSGTSGRPRGVVVSYRNLVASALGSKQRLGLGRDDVWLASLSPAHVGGLALVTRALLLGAQLVAVGSFDAERALALIDGRPPGSSGASGASGGPGGRPVSHVSVVPTQLLRMLEARGDEPPPETFRCALVGGARAPDGLVGRALGAGWPLALTYGLTEATSQVATAPPELTRTKPGTVGPPLDGVEVSIGEGGEILVRGPTVVGSYLGPGAPAVAAEDGWLHTGDVGRVDDDGHLWVTGRRSDRIVTGGVTVDAVEVEEALRTLPEVVDACVVGLPDEEWGERVAAWVVPSGAGLDPLRLQASLRDRLSGPKLPRVFHVGGELPRNPNGKVDRAAVRAAVVRGRGRDG